MTVPVQTIKNQYSGNDATTVFPYTYKIFQDSDLRVITRDPDGVEADLVLDTDYSVSGAGDEGGGSITYPLAGSPLPTGWTITLALNLPFSQLVDLIEQGQFFAETHETVFDRLTKFTQMLDEVLARCIKVDITSTDTPEELLTRIFEAEANAIAAAAAALVSQNAAKVSEDNAEDSADEAEMWALLAQQWYNAIKLPLPLTVEDIGKMVRVKRVDAGIYKIVSASSGQTIFTINDYVPESADSLSVFRNGQRLSKTTDYDYVSAGGNTTVTMVNPMTINDEVVFLEFASSGTSGGVYQRFVAVADQSAFTLSGYTPVYGNSLEVYRNGQRLTKVVDYDYNVQGTDTTILMTEDMEAGDEIIAFEADPVGINYLDQQAATAGQTIFTLTGFIPVSTNSLVIYRNGQRLANTVDYNYVTGGGNTTVTMTSPMTLDDDMIFFEPNGGGTSSVPDGYEFTAFTDDAMDILITVAHRRLHGIADPLDHSGVVTSVATPGVDTQVPTEKAVRDALTALAGGGVAHADTTGQTANDHHAQVHTAASHSDQASTGSQVDAAVAASHARQHAITSTSDHTGIGGYYNQITAGAGQTDFVLSSYVPVNANSLWVFRNGQMLTKGTDYTYSGSPDTTVVMTVGMTAGDDIVFREPIAG